MENDVMDYEDRQYPKERQAELCLIVRLDRRLVLNASQSVEMQ